QINLVAHSSDGFHETGTRTIRTLAANGSLERLFHPLAGNRDESEIIELKDLGRRAISAQGLLQRLHNFLPVAALVHVNEVDNDDAAQIAQPDLPHDFPNGVYIRLHDGVFQARRLAHIFAGIHIDGYQRFRLVDHDVATALEPNFGFE